MGKKASRGVSAMACLTIKHDNNTTRLQCASRSPALDFRWRNAALGNLTPGRILLASAMQEDQTVDVIRIGLSRSLMRSITERTT